MADPVADIPTIDSNLLRQALEEAHNDAELFEAIVNAPFAHKLETTFLFLGIMS